MAYDVVRPLMHEVLTMVNNAKVKGKKIEVLRKYSSEGLKMVLKSSFDPKIVWRLPEGDVPYRPNPAPMGTEHTLLEKEARKFYYFIKGGADNLPSMKKENMFIQMLEGLHEDEAKVLCLVKDKQLGKRYRITKAVVQEAFPTIQWGNRS